MDPASFIDRALELPVVTSFTRLGHDVRRRSDHWTPLSDYRMTGRTVLVTGASSGLGLMAAEQFARCGAYVLMLGRDAAKTERARAEVAQRTGSTSLEVVVADMGDLDAVRAAVKAVLAAHPRLDVLVHNAGALTADRRTAPSGMELTVASQVVGPFLLTTLLRPALAAAAPGRRSRSAVAGPRQGHADVRRLRRRSGQVPVAE